jgi:hypothetical protein
MELLKHFRHTNGSIDLISETPRPDCEPFDVSHIDDFYNRLNDLYIEGGELKLRDLIVNEIIEE